MTSKRDLESAIEALKHEVKSEVKRADRAWEKVTELQVFLADILELDPTLDHFRRDVEVWGSPTRVWDIEGVKVAKEFHCAQSIAANYSKQEIAGRRLYEAEKKAAK